LFSVAMEMPGLVPGISILELRRLELRRHHHFFP
jgi:hypothetical protein